jgi:hypothetical protein
MTIIDDIKRIKSGKRQLRNFGLTIGVACSVFGLLFWLRGKSYFVYFLFCSLPFLFFGILFPIVLKPIQKVWMAFSILLGWIITRIILFILYYFILTPISLIARLFGKDFLKLKINKDAKSYWLKKKIR